MNQLWYMHTVEYYMAIRKNELHAKAWMTLTDTFLNERNYWSHLYEVQKQGRLTYSDNQNRSHLWRQEVKGGHSLGGSTRKPSRHHKWCSTPLPPKLHWGITDRSKLHLRCTTWCYDILLHCEIITTIKLFRVVTSSLSHQGLCYFITYLRNPFLARLLIILSHFLWKVTNFHFLVLVFNPAVISFYECCEQVTFFATEKGTINKIHIKEIQIKTMRYYFIQERGRKFLKVKNTKCWWECRGAKTALAIPSEVKGTHALGTSSFTLSR